ncbi:hypothetical protein F3I50_03495 [Pantoea sp. M_5]|nr:hypothetical protein F3I50_03495 [Pantoea sp. M_5]
MNAAAAATPSSPQKTGITTGPAAKRVTRTISMPSTSTTTQSGASGDTPAIRCAGCPAWLTTEEVYCCALCIESWAESDPNGLMGVDDEESQEAL